jgi:hypothetical protein
VSIAGQLKEWELLNATGEIPPVNESSEEALTAIGALSQHGL